MNLNGLISPNDTGMIAAVVVCAIILTFFVTKIEKKILPDMKFLTSILVGALVVPTFLIVSSLILVLFAESNPEFGEFSSFVSPLLFWLSFLLLPVTTLASYLSLWAAK